MVSRYHLWTTTIILFLTCFSTPICFSSIDSPEDKLMVKTDSDSQAAWQLSSVRPTATYQEDKKTVTIKLHNVEVLCCNDCDHNKRKKDLIGTYLNPIYFNPTTIPTTQFQLNGTSPICKIYKIKTH